MEVHFNPDLQAKLDRMARDTGRRSDELVENVVTELPQANNRIDIFASGETVHVFTRPGWRNAGIA